MENTDSQPGSRALHFSRVMSVVVPLPFAAVAALLWAFPPFGKMDEIQASLLLGVSFGLPAGLARMIILRLARDYFIDVFVASASRQTRWLWLWDKKTMSYNTPYTLAYIGLCVALFYFDTFPPAGISAFMAVTLGCSCIEERAIYSEANRRYRARHAAGTTELQLEQ